VEEPVTSPESTPAQFTAPARTSGLLEESWRLHAGAAYDAAYRVTGNPSDAEDVVQTVFLRIARRPPVTAELGRGYFHRAAVHAALDILRSRQRAGWVPLEHADGAMDDADPASDLRRSRERRALRLALARLTPRSAEIFALRFFEGLSNPQIAALLGISTPLVAVLLHRTRARLRKELHTLLGDQS
jgi:RNA polymerase sigma-70 factor, ECF subfamily